MNRTLSLVVFFSSIFAINAQVGIGTTNPDQSSVLHIESSDAGLLIPRLTNAQKLSINLPATGLLIYQTNGQDGFWYFDGANWRLFDLMYNFNNGLSVDSNTAQLGGTLIKETVIDMDDFDLVLESNSTATFPGDFEIKGSSRAIFKTAINEDYAHFGDEFPFLGTLVDGTNLTTIGGDVYEIDVVAGFQSNKSIGGSSIKIGSVEYLIDGVDELYLQADSGFHPKEDQTGSIGASLGSSNNRWARVYANDGVIQTSDVRFKTNIIPLNYGLKEILDLNPIMFNWKDDFYEGKIDSTENLDGKIGLSAQELLEVVPEVVSEYNWVLDDEAGNYKKIKNEKLGVNYSELIPILIKAIHDLNNKVESMNKNR